MTIDGVPILPHTATVFAAINGEWGVKVETNLKSEVEISGVALLDPVQMILGTTPNREDAERIAVELRLPDRTHPLWAFGTEGITSERLEALTGLRWPTCFTEMGRLALQSAGG